MNILLSLLSILFFIQPNNAVINTPSQNADVVEINIDGTDQMTFSLKEIKVKAGSTVKLTLHHVGKLPKAAMGHNWVLLEAGTSVKDFGMSVMTEKDNDYIPKDGKNVIVHTDLIGGGESTTIEFEAPAKGEYPFLCSFPGHYGLMQGTFIVE